MSIIEWGFILSLLLLAITLIGRQKARWLAVLAVLATVVIYASHGGVSDQAWNIFHYYINSKYYGELGHDGLYACAVQVMGEGQRPGLQQFGPYARDLNSYEYVPVADLANCPREAFTNARWQQFGDDLEWILRRSRPGTSNNILLDKGYNMLPTWTAVVAPLANAAPLGSLQFLALLYADVLAISSGLLMMYRARGLEATAVATIFTTTYFGTYQGISGNWMQYMWLGAALAGLSAWHMDRRAIAGALLATAAALRIFPVFLFLWPVLHPKKTGKRFWAGASGAVVLWAMVGSVTSQGPEAWIEFAGKMATHSAHLVIEPLNIGLRNLVVMLSNPGTAKTHLEFFQTAAGDIVQLDYETTPLVWLLVAFVVLLVVVATWKRCRPSFAAGIAVMFAAVVLSRYYYQILSVVAFEGDPAAMRSLLALNAILLVTAGPWQLPGYIVWSLTLTAFLVAFYAVSRPFRGWGGMRGYGI